MKKILMAMVIMFCVCGVSIQFAEAAKKDLGLVELELIERHVPETWLEDMIYESAVERVTALQKSVEVVNAPTTENFMQYSTAAAAVLAGSEDPGDLEYALWPIGDKSCSTAAYALEADLRAIPEFAAQFDTKVVNAGATGSGIPMTHYVVEAMPKDKYGPAFLFDRYTGSKILQIDQMWKVTGYHPVLDKFVNNPYMNAMDWHYTVTTINDPETKFYEWMEIVKAGLVKSNCIMVDPVDGTSCTQTDMTNITTTVIVLPGLMPTVEDAQSALDSHVLSYPDGWTPCGNSISKKYYPNACGSNFGTCNPQLRWEMGCDFADIYGIDYLSRCVFRNTSEGAEWFYYVVGYQEFVGSEVCPAD